MKKTVSFIRRLSVIFICMFMLPLSSFPASAQGKTLRVAFYPLDGFFEYDENGNEVGYGVEVLDMISQYTGYNFEYIKADSWEDTKYMLLDDKADVRMPGNLPSVPSTELGYTEHSIIDTYYAIMTLKDRDDLYYQDYDTFAKIKVGVSESLYESTIVSDAVKSANIPEKNITFYDDYNKCRQALADGEIDALVSNIMDLDDGMKQLDRFSTMSNYISMRINSPELVVINSALSDIRLSDPMFLADLYKKWFPDRATVPFTKEETEYLKSVGSICFSFRDNQGYLSRRDEDGNFIGFYPDLAKSICKELGVDYKETDAQDEQIDGVAVYMDFYYDYNWAEEYDTQITQPYVTVNYYEVTRRNSNVDKKTCKVAAVKDFRVTKDYIRNGYSESQMIWCDDYAECIDAVSNGIADISYVNSNAAEYYLELYRYNALTSALTEYSHMACMGVYGDNSSMLVSILNKELTSITSDEIESFIIGSTSTRPQQDYFMEWIYQNPVRSILIVSSFVAVLIFVIVVLIFVNRIRKQNIALSNATHTRQDFLSRMSHDMRTPMNAVIGFSKFGCDSKSLNEALSYHNKIYESGQYLLQLINDSLELTKMQSGNYKLNPEPYRNKDFIEQIKSILLIKAREKYIKFTINSDNEELVVMFDKIRVQQIFLNLLNNAIKFTKSGGEVSLTTTAQINDDNTADITFVVLDTGTGMSEDFVKNKLFKAFEQENSNVEEQGTGLGLSIVKELVTAMDGTIECESKLGEGTKFTVKLKAEIVDSLPEPIKFSDVEKSDEVFIGKRILLCDDHPLNIEIIKKLLTNKGMLVECANNGQVCADMFEASKERYYSAILMDIRMPVLDGFGAAKLIRNMKRSDALTVPIIAVSANTFEEDIKECHQAGMNDHLSKPIDCDMLYKKLAEYL